MSSPGINSAAKGDEFITCIHRQFKATSELRNSSMASKVFLIFTFLMLAASRLFQPAVAQQLSSAAVTDVLPAAVPPHNPTTLGEKTAAATLKKRNYSPKCLGLSSNPHAFHPSNRSLCYHKLSTEFTRVWRN
uniref:Uncharacterized protein n=1 Tax=Ananas comosus var. bracteatus TaxID=296719 RepID=A0A6V7PVP6_ANACO|nr:unnamed protein product [Ananas comosus var. bracteatus]